MKKFFPDNFFKTIYDIDYQQLKDKGFTALFFDLDNTLIPYDVEKITEQVSELFSKIAHDFDILVITNNNQERTERALGSHINFLSNAKKPFKKGYLKALDLMNCSSNQVVAIGDQLMTDVLGASKMGFYSILVNPIDQNSEGFPTKINRFREKRVLKKLAKKYPTLFKARLANFDVR